MTQQKKSHKPFEEPRGYGWGFNADKGTLTFFSPTTLRTYRANPPAAWWKSKEWPHWRGSFGAEDFQIGQLAAQNRRYEIRLRVDMHAGHMVRRRGLFSMGRFYERLDPQACAPVLDMQTNSWSLYGLLCRSPRVLELAQTHLPLALRLAWLRQQNRWRFARIDRLARKKRTDLLVEAGFPGQKQWLRVMGLIPPSALSFTTLNNLRHLADFHPDAIETLRHLPAVHNGVLRLVLPDYCRYVHPRLLRQVALDHREQIIGHAFRGRIVGLIEDTVRMGNDLDRPIPVLASLQQVEELHDSLARVSRNLKFARLRPFREPPLPETDYIKGLRTPLQLRDESDAMRNCLSSAYWADDCYQGRLYVYQIQAPERASVAIAPDSEGRWKIIELKARFNKEVSASTRAAVQTWVRIGNAAIKGGWRPQDSEQLSTEELQSMVEPAPRPTPIWRW